MEYRNFKEWDYQMIGNTFGIKRVKKHPALDKWLSVKHSPNELEKNNLLYLREDLLDRVDGWNEYELQMMFIGPILMMVNYNTGPFGMFFQRDLQATINDIKVGGRVDFMVAKGKRYPEEPYFFIHEYKKEQGYTNDPLGQVLIAMLAARTENGQSSSEPVHGVYVLGRFWFFVILVENEFAVSLAYDATKDELFDIFSMLMEVKSYVKEKAMALV